MVRSGAVRGASVMACVAPGYLQVEDGPRAMHGAARDAVMPADGDGADAMAHLPPLLLFFSPAT